MPKHFIGQYYKIFKSGITLMLLKYFQAKKVLFYKTSIITKFKPNIDNIIKKERITQTYYYMIFKICIIVRKKYSLV